MLLLEGIEAEAPSGVCCSGGPEGAPALCQKEKTRKDDCAAAAAESAAAAAVVAVVAAAL